VSAIDILERVAQIINDTLKRADTEITGQTNIIDDLKLNSLEVAELICAFENTFGIEIADREVTRLRVVRDIAAYLEKKTNAG